MAPLHPLTGTWRVSWLQPPNKVRLRDAREITYGTLPPRCITVTDFRQHINVEERAWTEEVHVRFDGDVEAVWTLRGNLEPPLEATAPFDVSVKFRYADLVGTTSRLEYPGWLVPYLDRGYDVPARATMTTIVVTPTSRVDRNTDGSLALLHRC
jgi:hypothetical protein